MKKPRFANVDEYVEAAPEQAQKKLRALRECIRKGRSGSRGGPEMGHAGVLLQAHPRDVRSP